MEKKLISEEKALIEPSVKSIRVERNGLVTK